MNQMKKNKLEQITRLGLGIVFAALAVLMIIPLFFRTWNAGSLFFLGLGMVGLTVCIFWGKVLRLVCAKRKRRILFYGLLGLFATGICWCIALSFFISRAKPEIPAEKENLPVLILGSKVDGTEPSVDLQKRIDRAADWLLSHPNSIAVACGGEGTGEKVTEAEVIREKLLEKGIEPGRILLENRSVNTEQNLFYAKKVLLENNLPNKEVLLLTDDYHLYRALLIAKQNGLTAWGISVSTPPLVFPALFARELFAVTKYFVLG
ncbi:MAG: YdcF family protein [Clostridiales bacterium]|jgi:uncharacterized SAM-binding protein YcdF (DUF218 family)|nr:YdcF family protein [Clostridiales bacterium]MCI2022747.1 YdcF family protein [Clostridiales bacterium]MCI2026938.1 YdcF family protein [Clostridiales bacterium]MCI2190824.1 YdcF family protein [Oscillospiraceae bacterium]